MISTQRIGRIAPADRSDTQLIPLPGLRPTPHRLDPRAADVVAAAARALIAFAVVAVATLVLGAVIVAGALVVPPSLLLAGACALALLYPAVAHRRAR